MTNQSFGHSRPTPAVPCDAPPALSQPQGLRRTSSTSSPSFSPDLRMLPICEPADKHNKAPPPPARFNRSWTWESWKAWLRRCWDRTRWHHKKELDRVIRLRGSPSDWRHSSLDFDRCGAIYAIYHCPSGRLYVGSTINEIWERARHHWWSRFREDDLFHDALSGDVDPFSSIVIPLEWIREEDYHRPGAPRKAVNAAFRRVALPREQFWVARLGTMWPQGWNSTIPGRPVRRWIARQPQNSLQGEVDPSIAAWDPEAWLTMWHRDQAAALAHMAGRPKADIRLALHHVQAREHGDPNRPNLSAGPQDHPNAVPTQSPVEALFQLLRQRKQDPPARQFLRFKYTHNSARDLQLREVLRDPTVYSKHPDPEVAAAIMLSERFEPQIQALLFNYAEAATELNIQQALTDTLADCKCRECFALLRPGDLGPDGHVCTFDTSHLKWPYLQNLTERGKKFRLPKDAASVAEELDQALQHYLRWATKDCENPRRLQQFQEWADTVRSVALSNWRRAQSKKAMGEMDGYPGLRKAISEARTHLLFVHDDRAPHGLFIFCKRWYQRNMAEYLNNSSVFQPVAESWPQVAARLKSQLAPLGFEVGTGVPYNYGCWKPKKSKFRYIAGTRKATADEKPAPPQPAPPADKPKADDIPRSPTYHLSKALVTIYKHAIRTIEELDTIREREVGFKCFWSIDSANAFSRLARLNASFIVAHGMATHDFTTMYTSFDQETMVKNLMEALTEAQQFEGSKCPEEAAAPSLCLKGWTFGDGWSLPEVEAMARLTIGSAFTVNGGQVRRQCLGLPMGLPEAPQLVALALYPIEKRFALATRPCGVICRFIDDFFSSGTQPPPPELYGMDYHLTSTSPTQVEYLGVRATIKEGRLHTTLFDREEDYPFHIVRYPEWSTTAPKTQLAGVLIGRFVNCQDACTYVADFQASVSNVVRHALWRGYPAGVIVTTWSRFLHRKWQATDIRKAELFAWFKKLLAYQQAKGIRPGGPDPRQAQQPIWPAPEDPEFQRFFGYPANAAKHPNARNPFSSHHSGPANNDPHTAAPHATRPDHVEHHQPRQTSQHRAHSSPQHTEIPPTKQRSRNGMTWTSSWRNSLRTAFPTSAAPNQHLSPHQSAPPISQGAAPLLSAAIMQQRAPSLRGIQAFFNPESPPYSAPRRHLGPWFGSTTTSRPCSSPPWRLQCNLLSLLTKPPGQLQCNLSPSPPGRPQFTLRPSPPGRSQLNLSLSPPGRYSKLRPVPPGHGQCNRSPPPPARLLQPQHQWRPPGRDQNFHFHQGPVSAFSATRWSPSTMTACRSSLRHACLPEAPPHGPLSRGAKYPHPQGFR